LPEFDGGPHRHLLAPRATGSIEIQSVRRGTRLWIRLTVRPLDSIRGCTASRYGRKSDEKRCHLLTVSLDHRPHILRKSPACSIPTSVATDPLRPTTLSDSVALDGPSRTRRRKPLGSRAPSACAKGRIRARGCPRHRPDCELGDRGSDAQAIVQGLRARRIMPWLAKRNTERVSGLG